MSRDGFYACNAKRSGAWAWLSVRHLGRLGFVAALALGGAVEAGQGERQVSRRVFVGRVVSSTLTPVEPARSGTNGSLSISLTCAEAATTYRVSTAGEGGQEDLVVHSSLGEWCDMPLGIDGAPVLVDATRHGDSWWENDVWLLYATRDGRYVLLPDVPGGAAEICGLTLSTLRSPLAADDEIPGDAGEIAGDQRAQLIARHMARIESDGALVFTAAVGLDRLFDALRATPCGIGSTTPPHPGQAGGKHGTARPSVIAENPFHVPAGGALAPVRKSDIEAFPAHR